MFLFIVLAQLCLRELEQSRRKLPLWGSLSALRCAAVVMLQDGNVKEVISLGLVERTAFLMALDFK